MARSRRLATTLFAILAMLGLAGCNDADGPTPSEMEAIRVTVRTAGEALGRGQQERSELPATVFPESRIDSRTEPGVFTRTGPAAPASGPAGSGPGAEADLDGLSRELTGMSFDALMARQNGATSAVRRAQAMRVLDTLRLSGSGPLPEAPGGGSARELPAFESPDPQEAAEAPHSGVEDRVQCWRNQDNLAMAVEAYNRRNNTAIDRLDTQVLHTLLVEGYLESVPEDPGQGPGSGWHYRLTGGDHSINGQYVADGRAYPITGAGSGVTCSVHGSEADACYAEQAAVARAVASYNRRNNTVVRELDDALIDRLASEDYLDWRPIHPDPWNEEGVGRYYSLTEESPGITCDIHGHRPLS